MFKYLILTVVFILMVMSCTKEDVSITAIANDYHEERLLLFPIDATLAGDNRYNDLLPNYNSKAFKKELIAFYEKYLALLAKVDKTQLSAEDKLTHEILEWECTIHLEDLQYPSELMPIDQFWSLNLFVGQLASGSAAQPFKTVQDYENWLKRVDGYISWCDSAISNMKEGIVSGYVLPESLIKKVIPQIASFSAGPVGNHHFYLPVTLLPENFSAEEKEKITAAYSSMVLEKIIPVHQRLLTFLENEYLPAGRVSSGYSDLPRGGEWYKTLIKYYTTTTMTADEIHNLGLAEVQRILQEMEEVKETVGFKGDLKAFFDHVLTNKKLIPFDQPDQVIANFNKIHARMKPFLAELFDLVPKTQFEVRRTEAFREVSASAEYNSGSIDGTRPGIFYQPIPNVKKHNVFKDESLFLHEAIPGHHYQISLQQENTTLPAFRQTLWYSAYGEGWALYTENLGRELGLYEDPYQYFGMLSAEIHRAIRLVVDTGIHAKGWTREQAIQYSLANEAETEADVVREIERYMAGPAQALSYKIGQLKIRELRAKANEELGEKFNIREFHNKVLESGCIPLNILERKINNWIQSEKQI